MRTKIFSNLIFLFDTFCLTIYFNTRRYLIVDLLLQKHLRTIFEKVGRIKKKLGIFRFMMRFTFIYYKETISKEDSPIHRTSA